jgi:hypothetical protein
VKGTQATGNWTLEEDAKLKSAIMSTRKKKCGKMYRIDWVAIAALVPDRTRTQCRGRWHRAINTARTGEWTADEDIKLKDAVQAHNGNNWGAIAALVADRTTGQCRYRWQNVLNLSIDPTTACTGEWTADEDIKLKDAVKMHGGNNWGKIAALVPGRTTSQCRYRWYSALDPKIDWANRRKGFWAEVEDADLTSAFAVVNTSKKKLGNEYNQIRMQLPFSFRVELNELKYGVSAHERKTLS